MPHLWSVGKTFATSWTGHQFANRQTTRHIRPYNQGLFRETSLYDIHILGEPEVGVPGQKLCISETPDCVATV